MKRILAVFLLLCAVLCSFVSCSGNGGGSGETATGGDAALAGTYDITVWVSEIAGVKELTEKQIRAFEAANPGIRINAKIEGITEKESATSMITSVSDGADLFCFAQDQLARLVVAGALTKLGQATAAQVSEVNTSASVAAATVGGSIYCFPMTADNGYLMYYDKSVIKPENVGSLEGIISDCRAAGRLFSFELENSAWYNSSFFFATGCVSEWTTNDKGEFTGYKDTFDSDAGVIALRGMQKLLRSTVYNNSSNASDFDAAIKSAVVVSGAWDAVNAEKTLGDNFAAAPLPSFTVDGKTYQLGSFSGNKLMGVKPQQDAKKSAVLQRLALYLTGEECQAQRFEQFGWGPSNKAVAESDAVKKNPALAALTAQNEFAIPQGQFPGNWWDTAKAYATAAKNAKTDDTAALKRALASYADAIRGMVKSPS